MALGLPFDLGENAEMIRDTVRDFAKKEIAPRAAEVDRKNEFPADLWRKLGDLGVLGLTVAEEYGGTALGYLAHMLAMEEISRASASVGLSYGAHSNLCVNQIRRNGTEAQRQKYLPDLASGEIVGCFGLTEPDHGSDPGGMTTRARREAGGYRLDGAKTWITNSPIADIAIVWAKTDDGPIRGFIVERRMAGFSTPTIDSKVSLRASITGEIVLEGVFVPDANLLPNVAGLKGPFGCLNNARFGIAWGAIGAAESCWRTARQYVLDRTQFGRPLAANQLVQKKLADMQTELALALGACLQAGRMKEQDLLAPEAISLIKRNSCLKALEIARTARDMLGGNGISDEYPIIRHMLNLEAVNTYEGTADIHALILGRAQTGIQAFS